MPYTFQTAERAFKNDLIRELGQDPQGLRFLKLRSLSRNDQMDRLINDHNLPIAAGKPATKLRALFESNITDIQIDATIRSIYFEERQDRSASEDALITELYKLQVFDWGGLHQNSLERTIVDNYVKKIRSLDDLQTKIDDDLFKSMKAYVLCSWYNHWTSIIIEDVFRDHPAVLPAVGLIKKVDFFVRNVPYDLKVTYLPEGYIKERRRELGLREELSILRTFCRSENIHFDPELPAARLLEDLWAKVSDHPSPEGHRIVRELKAMRLQILEYAKGSPTDLIKWLYENQGVRRFDASNRLFLVLVDCDNFFESWKLKRAKPLLVDRIHSHLSRSTRSGYELTFIWMEEQYSTTSDIIFVTHDRNC